VGQIGLDFENVLTFLEGFQFVAEDQHIFGGLDSEADLIAADADNGDYDGIAKPDPFSFFSREY
jgi:hypothetical protein